MIIDSTNSSYSPYGADIKNNVARYIISKDYGLIYFQLESGEEYYRKFKSSAAE